METLPNGYTLLVPKDAFPLSTDSVVLGHFVRLPKNARVLDLGSGCGTLGMLLCAKDETCTVTGLELSPAAHEAALENIRANGLARRMESICADLREVPSRFASGSFSVCVSNPPYFTGGPASVRHPQARHEEQCSLSQLFASVGWALKYGGDFFLVHKPDRLSEILLEGAKVGMEAKRLCLLRHREGGSICQNLLQLRKGAKPGLIWEEMALEDGNGNPTQAFRDIYHISD